MDFSFQLKCILERSQQITNVAVQSIDSIDGILDSLNLNSNAIDNLKHRRLSNDNINKAVLELDNYLKLTDAINKDKFNITYGHRGSVNEYILNLVHLQSFQKYTEYDQDNDSLTLLTLINLSCCTRVDPNFMSEPKTNYLNRADPVISIVWKVTILIIWRKVDSFMSERKLNNFLGHCLFCRG